MRFLTLIPIAAAPIAIALCVAPASATSLVDDKASEREIRSLQKQVTKLEKRYDKLIKRCTGDERNRPDARACDTARVTYQDVQQLKKQIAALGVEQR